MQVSCSSLTSSASVAVILDLCFVSGQQAVRACACERERTEGRRDEAGVI